MSIYLTGASGFVGKNLVSSLDKNVLIKKHMRDSRKTIKDCVIYWEF